MKCSAALSDGSGCQAEALVDGQHCAFHDKRQEWRARHVDISRKGGKAAHAAPGPVDLRVDVSTAEGILRTLQEAAQAVVDGRMDRARSNSLGYLCATANQALKVHRFEERVRKIEVRLGLRESEEEA